MAIDCNPFVFFSDGKTLYVYLPAGVAPEAILC